MLRMTSVGSWGPDEVVMSKFKCLKKGVVEGDAFHTDGVNTYSMLSDPNLQ